MELDRNGLEVLTRDECLRLLATATIGRVGLATGDVPMVLPVNFCVVDNEVVIRTAKGTKLATAVNHARIAFEVDDFHAMDHSGWSVIVTGRAAEVTDVDHLARLQRAPVSPWAELVDTHLIVLPTDAVSGRRLIHGITNGR